MKKIKQWILYNVIARFSYRYCIRLREKSKDEYVRARLRKAEEAGFTDLSAEEIRQEVRNELDLDG